jgi:hypothetical protein
MPVGAITRSRTSTEVAAAFVSGGGRGLERVQTSSR